MFIGLCCCYLSENDFIIQNSLKDGIGCLSIIILMVHLQEAAHGRIAHTIVNHVQRDVPAVLSVAFVVYHLQRVALTKKTVESVDGAIAFINQFGS